MNTPENKKDDRSRDEVLAGEYVLGVLPADERRAVEQRLASDVAFRTMVNRWQNNLSGFDDAYGPELVPSPKVYAQIERDLFGEAAAPKKNSIWNSLLFWQGATLISAAAALLLFAAGPSALGPQAEKGPVQLAELSSSDGNIGLVAYYDASNGSLQLTPAASGGATQKSLELWMIDGDNAPESLGVVPFERDGIIRVPDKYRPRMKEGITLAVSLEPYGGSKTGAPTGPVLMSGKVGSI